MLRQSIYTDIYNQFTAYIKQAHLHRNQIKCYIGLYIKIFLNN